MSTMAILQITTDYIGLFVIMIVINVVYAEDPWSLVISPKGPITVRPGDKVTVNCSLQTALTNVGKWQPSLTWNFMHDIQHLRESVQDAAPGTAPTAYATTWLDNSTLQLIIENVRPQHAGPYICQTATWIHANSPQTIRILVENSVEATTPVSLIMSQWNRLTTRRSMLLNPRHQGCSDHHFQCHSDGFCIFSRYRCDGQPDCKDASDEMLCPQVCKVMEFRCDNGQCIPLDNVCDAFESEDCRDGSDERNCPGRFYPPGENAVTSSTPIVDPSTPHHNHGFHFHAIYSAIAALLAILVISTVLMCSVRRYYTRRRWVQPPRRTPRAQAEMSGRDGVRIYFYGVVDRLSSSGGGGGDSGSAEGSVPWRWRSQPSAGAAGGDDPSGGGDQRVRYQRDASGVHEVLLPPRCNQATGVSGHIMLNISAQGVPEFPPMPKPPTYEEIEPLVPGNRAGTPPPPYTTMERARGGVRGSQRAGGDGGNDVTQPRVGMNWPSVSGPNSGSAQQNSPRGSAVTRGQSQSPPPGYTSEDPNSISIANTNVAQHMENEPLLAAAATITALATTTRNDHQQQPILSPLLSNQPCVDTNEHANMALPPPQTTTNSAATTQSVPPSVTNTQQQHPREVPSSSPASSNATQPSTNTATSRNRSGFYTIPTRTAGDGAQHDTSEDVNMQQQQNVQQTGEESRNTASSRHVNTLPSMSQAGGQSVRRRDMSAPVGADESEGGALVGGEGSIGSEHVDGTPEDNISSSRL